MLNYYAIPGSDGPKTSGQNYVAWAPLANLGGVTVNFRLGYVSFQSELGGQRIRNTTLPDHLMRYGSVEMRIIGSQRDGFSIVGIGYGSNINSVFAAANSAFGPSAFRGQIAKMAEALKQCN